MNITKIGILGGGQLARMMVMEGKRLGFSFWVLDPEPNCPASLVGATQLLGSFQDEAKICELAEQVDILTFDIEHVNINQVKELEAKGVLVRPSPRVLAVIQDKFQQRCLLKNAGIPGPDFVLPDLKVPLEQYFGFPFVQKLRYGGYDGQGVIIIKEPAQLAHAFEQDFYLEQWIEVEKELSVLIALSSKEEKVYPVVEMLFDSKTNICNQTLCPARIDQATSKQAQVIGLEAVKALGAGAIGIFAVEMFLAKDGSLLVNEIAPRPHNSGHFTLDGCITSQFEQHLRAITDLSLGSPDLLIPTLMLNILGEGTGIPAVEGLNQCLAIPGVKVHFYQKRKVRPFRKMGHVNIVDRALDNLLTKAQKVNEILKVKART